ncbi:Cadmium, cobalt and zinc/H(+)-K(+) antiporter [Polaribacter huanghezhanensis]|uniref:cation diffusion facilitator family transporter n=1 Tax=Polaribacter huanghezhanensis TaxID=1354726 RepID=UPI002648BD13|nr:cation diffusion facilitator family transporter [Polaribacter huanghezhanensis]WKD86725.1 Cadmium, cobalt and zinc/H(+)-K(+) antiporter [Polaribacter huanghezhanensis]
MAHNHENHHATENIKTAFFLNIAFTIIEIIGGFYTNSLAIMSDAVHDLGDSLSLGMSWYFQKLSNKEANKKYSYGYGRFSLLGAIINSIVLLIGSIFIIVEAIPRIKNPEEANATGMMWFAILGIIVNGAAVLKLKKGSSINERVVSLHFIEDVLGWVAVLIASIVMQFWNVPLLDTILSLGIAGYVLFNVYKNIKDAFKIILQGVPDKISSDEIKEQIILNIDGVEDVHDFHIWTLDGEYHIATIHIILKNKEFSWQESKEIKKHIKQLLHDNFQLEHVTLELESISEDCAYKDCN